MFGLFFLYFLTPVRHFYLERYYFLIRMILIPHPPTVKMKRTITNAMDERTKRFKIEQAEEFIKTLQKEEDSPVKTPVKILVPSNLPILPVPLNKPKIQSPVQKPTYLDHRYELRVQYWKEEMEQMFPRATLQETMDAYAKKFTQKKLDGSKRSFRDIVYNLGDIEYEKELGKFQKSYYYQTIVLFTFESYKIEDKENEDSVQTEGVSLQKRIGEITDNWIIGRCSINGFKLIYPPWSQRSKLMAQYKKAYDHLVSNATLWNRLQQENRGIRGKIHICGRCFNITPDMLQHWREKQHKVHDFWPNCVDQVPYPAVHPNEIHHPSPWTLELDMKQEREMNQDSYEWMFYANVGDISYQTTEILKV